MCDVGHRNYWLPARQQLFFDHANFYWRVFKQNYLCFTHRILYSINSSFEICFYCCYKWNCHCDRTRQPMFTVTESIFESSHSINCYRRPIDYIYCLLDYFSDLHFLILIEVVLHVFEFATSTCYWVEIYDAVSTYTWVPTLATLTNS